MDEDIEYYSSKDIRWNIDKEEWLQQHRKVSFEEAAEKIRSKDVIEVIDGLSKSRPLQPSFVVRLKGYVYYVPFIDEPDYLFLKTIVPNSDLNKKYWK